MGTAHSGKIGIKLNKVFMCTVLGLRLAIGNTNIADFNVLLTVRLSIFISLFNRLDAQNLFHNKFYFMPLHVSSTYARNM